ncbi:DNA polymerase-3 subunit epsilon [Saccharothrix ecbatanensis]|jgi:DNA polymerase-3 subunit epsilon|uniref:DNA polymerase-3 subunit epsilon n=1 Tax=Saccharothrix ecbatanensis TaxID=1105145 RepID=A0A7W9HQR7_9PSEU|nr:exonuclease domain-containing protein [Saccharothrix ecbatanensis]MBB5806737.1 DNA polymerase-3 subunit epsilon [Saccharothrix ecbatanensis]
MEYAVVDVETTGFAARGSDRIVEVAVVQLDSAGRVTGEWCTLLNPGRDLGPQHVHRIRAADVWHAPTFAQAAGALAARLAGRVVVAHNLSFDARFLTAEFARVGVDLPVDGLCTMRLAARYLPDRVGRSLKACCEAAGVVLESAHSALHDARATARLFAHYVRFGVPDAEPVADVPLNGDVVEVRRGAAAVTHRRPELVTLVRGDRVVFTGQMHSPRDEWIDRAASFGLVSQGYVTKATRVLVAADPFTLSSKAQRARAYRVPIVSEEDFAGMLGLLGVTPPAKDHRTEWRRAY